MGLCASVFALGLASPEGVGVDVGHWCRWSGGPVVHSPSITAGEDGNNEFNTPGAKGGSLWAGGDYVQETAVRQNVFQAKI